MAGDFGRQAVADAADEMGLDSLARFRGDDRFLAVTQPFADGAVFADDGDPGAAHQTNGTVAEPRYPAVVDGAEPFGKGEQRVYVLVGPDTWAYTVDAAEDAPHVAAHPAHPVDVVAGKIKSHAAAFGLVTVPYF